MKHRALCTVLVVFGLASLVHFVHNAEFVRDYPSLPATWTRADVYLGWIGMTAIGMFGWALLARGHDITASLAIAVYAALGLDSLGHYAVAPMAAHTFAMNATILSEVTSAALVLIAAMRLLVNRRPSPRSPATGSPGQASSPKGEGEYLR